MKDVHLRLGKGYTHNGIVRGFLLLLFGLLMLSAPKTVFAQWEDPINAHPQTDFDDRFPRLAVASDGQTWLFWLGVDPIGLDTEIYWSRWSALGWEPAATVNPPNNESELPPQVSARRDGLWVLWASPNASVPGAYLGLASVWSGSGWTAPDTVWSNGARHNGWAVGAVDRTEAWFIRDGASAFGSSDIFVYHHHNGVRDPEFQFVQPDSDEVIPSIVVDDTNTPWAVWYQVSLPDPPASPLQYSRLIGSEWSEPAQIPAPTGPVAPKLTTDSTGVPWIVALVDNPALGVLATEAWALRWSGSEWGQPILISGTPIPRTRQFQLSVSDEPGTNPVAIWVRKDAFSATRADMIHTRWTGEVWTAPELVGSLDDSTLVTWPDVARQGSTVRAAYNAGVGSRTFVQNVFSIRSASLEAFAETVEFSARVGPNGVMLKWSHERTPDLTNIRIRRKLLGHHGFDIVAEFHSDKGRNGNFVDRTVQPGTYEYWIEFVFTSGALVSVGPRTAVVGERMRPWQLSGALNDSQGGVTFWGSTGVEEAPLISIYNVAGRRLRSIKLERTPLTVEVRFQLRWDGLTQTGSRAPAGVYFARLTDRGGNPQNALRFILSR